MSESQQLPTLPNQQFRRDVPLYGLLQQPSRELSPHPRTLGKSKTLLAPVFPQYPQLFHVLDEQDSKAVSRNVFPRLATTSPIAVAGACHALAPETNPQRLSGRNRQFRISRNQALQMRQGAGLVPPGGDLCLLDWRQP